MKSFLRQFVYLIVDGQRPSTLDLYRINMSRFFNPRSPVNGAMVDARLPRPSMTFYAPSSEHRSGDLQFMLLDRDKVVATDQMGRAIIYDAGRHAVSTAPNLSRPKHRPVSVAVGGSLYILDSSRRVVGAGEKEHCFEALVYERGDPGGVWYNDWRYRSLPTPPYRPADISACAVIGGSYVWVSTEEGGTYSFDTAQGAWAKQGDWTLPFRGLAEYVPEYKLWFGLSSKKDSNLFCAFDLAAAARLQSPPTPRNVWEDLRTPEEWLPVTSSLVHLGSGRFCIARLFCDTRRKPRDDIYDDAPLEMLVVLTAVEVEPCGKRGNGLGYDILHQWVL